VPFDLTLIPRLRTRRLKHGVIMLHALSDTFQVDESAPFSSSHPVLECMCLVLFEESDEVLTELIRTGELLACLTHLLDLSLLDSSQLLLSQHEQPGGSLGREPMTFWRGGRRSTSGRFGRRGSGWKLLTPLGGDAFQLSPRATIAMRFSLPEELTPMLAPGRPSFAKKRQRGSDDALASGSRAGEAERQSALLLKTAAPWDG
jgi:hypothetical protein